MMCLSSAGQEFAIFVFPCASVSKRVFMQNLSYGKKFDLHENETAGGTHFHVNSFTLRLVLIQRQQETWV